MTRSALVVGLGIAGMSAAKQLSEAGWDVTVAERAASRRTGGYFIAMFSTGRASAKRLGLFDALPTRARAGSRTWEVSRSGRRTPGMSIANAPDAPTMLLRGDVEEVLFAAMPDDVEIRFGTVPVRIEQDPAGAEVTTRTALAGADPVERTERYDLVIGADGVRSSVRRLVFGPDANFVHELDYMIAAALMEEDVTGFERGDSVIVSEPGRSATTFAFADRAPSLLFSYRTDDPAAELVKDPVDAVREAFGPEPAGDVLGELLEAYANAEEKLFDVAQQVRMRQWHSGRVALIGDAAWCMTLYSGLGASSGIAGAELLGGLLRRHDHDVEPALAEWNRRMHPFVDYQHRTIEQSRFIFTSADRGEHLRRKAMMRLMSSRPASKLMAKSMSRNESFAMKAVDIGAL